MSIATAIIAPFAELLFLANWFKPGFIYDTGIFIKFESLLFGFSTGGLSASLYQVVSGQRFEMGQHAYQPAFIHQVVGVVVGFSLFVGLFVLFGINSFWTSLLACTFIALCVAWRRPDLICVMLVSGVSLALLALLPYWFVLEFLNPNWFAEEWYLENLSGLWVLGLPVEEVAWYFYSGAAFSALWKCRYAAVEQPQEMDQFVSRLVVLRSWFL